jgi:hypothetical protein
LVLTKYRSSNALLTKAEIDQTASAGSSVSWKFAVMYSSETVCGVKDRSVYCSLR